MKFLKPSIKNGTEIRSKFFLVAARSIFVVLFLLPIFLIMGTAHAATLSVDPKTGNFGPGDTFVVTVRLDLEPDECINAANVELLYPKDWMKASAVSKGESLLTLWPIEPAVNHEGGIVNFSGGIPGGYCGRILGDPGKTNILGKIVFTIPGNMIDGKPLAAPMSLDLTLGPNTQVLQNDGFGTPAPLTFSSGTYVRTLTPSGKTNEWLDIVNDDTTPPDLFTAAIVQDPKTFQGKYFIVFSTVDKQSGVHHFEVQEDDPQRFGMVRGTQEKSIFIVATSPYVLRDQELGSRILVRAIDHAGNMQEAILPPKGDHPISANSTPGGKISSVWWYALGGLTLLLISAVAFYVVRKRNNNVIPE